MVKTDGWLVNSKMNSNILFNNMINLGVNQFIYTDINRDGTLSEPNYKHIIEILENFRINLTVAGGIATIENLEKLKTIGAHSAISGMALYEGKINLVEAIKKLL